jgi:hypothetical protein
MIAPMTKIMPQPIALNTARKKSLTCPRKTITRTAIIIKRRIYQNTLDDRRGLPGVSGFSGVFTLGLFV